MEKRVSRSVKKEDIDYFINLSEDELFSTSFIMETFGEFDGKRKYEPYDTITIPAGVYGHVGKKNKTPFITTVGIWIFNRAFIEKDFFNLFGYINKEINKKTFEWINDTISYAVMEDEVPLSALKNYIMNTQKYMPYVHILTPNHTMKMLTITEPIDKKKKELIKKYKNEIDAGDEKIADKIQSELLDYARELLGDDPSMDMYLSGAKGSFDNNFKNLFVMRGAIKDPDPNKGYNIVTSSYMDGISKDEYAKLANSLAAGPYKRAKKTEIGGYLEKLFISAFQHMILDKKDSDCGTKRYIEVDVDKDNINDIMYSYVIEGDKLVEITSKNRNKFIGKTVKLRFSSMCESDRICNACAGNMFYRLNLMNVGNATPQIPSKLKTLSMKGFHDSSIRYAEMDIMKVFGIE